MLKKFSQFTNETVTPVPVPLQTPAAPKKEQPKVQAAAKGTAIITPKPAPKKEEKVVEEIVFAGKIVKFPKNTKATAAYKLLEDRQISREKLHYILTEHQNHSILVLKYNPEASLRLSEFTQSLLDVYAKTPQLLETVKNIKVEGNETYVIISHLPPKFLPIVSEDLCRLLAKK